MADSKIVEEWLAKGREDFEYAKASLEAEKFLKAYILAKESKLLKIHDLTTLAKISAKYHKDFQSIVKAVAKLNPYYIEARYPQTLGWTVTKKQALESLDIAVKVKQLVNSALRV
jgi:HEPN domain-containing protein